MTSRNRRTSENQMSEDYLSSTISSSTLEIVLDDQSLSNSAEEDSNFNERKSTAGTTTNARSTCRRKKQLPLRDPKSHRLIEKRRRDRMNAYLNELLELTPHGTSDGQKRIEKTEIIEMAIKHMRCLISTLEKKSQNSGSNLDSYRTGYRNGLSDIYEHLADYSDSDQLLFDLTQLFKEKETNLRSLTEMPAKKRPKYLSVSDNPTRLSTSSKEQIIQPNVSNSGNDELCVITEVEQINKNDFNSSTDNQQNSTEQTNTNVKVPIFVLHPSGTHYIPMCIDASVVSHAFKKCSNSSRSLSTSEQSQCHPVSIPVNFNPITAVSDPYELDVQNINVIGTRHKISVRPD